MPHKEKHDVDDNKVFVWTVFIACCCLLTQKQSPLGPRLGTPDLFCSFQQTKCSPELNATQHGKFNVLIRTVVLPKAMQTCNYRVVVHAINAV